MKRGTAWQPEDQVEGQSWMEELELDRAELVWDGDQTFGSVIWRMTRVFSPDVQKLWEELPVPINKNIMVLELLSEVDFSLSNLAKKYFEMGLQMFKLKKKNQTKKQTKKKNLLP